ncbi:MAG: helix-turn-helix domain-containing protein [Rhodocyclaceae bacterium]|nr:helix-turn-helix domain-containing protein [Rhodocyclaceae bacterium]
MGTERFPVNNYFGVHMVSIGERLREERQRLGLSQTAFAELPGITKKTQMLYESGERLPDAAYLASISIAGADVLYIVTGERDGPLPLKHDEQTLLEGYRALDAATKRRMLAFVLSGEPAGQAGAVAKKIVVEGNSSQIAGRNIVNSGGGKRK